MTNDPSATLDDFGNFVLREGDKILWQSSNDPTDTLLPSMKLGLFNLKSGKPQKQFLNSWISLEFPDAASQDYEIDGSGGMLFIFQSNDVGVSRATDTLRVGDQMRDYENLESSNKRFQLRFFNPGEFNERYLGIHHSNNVVWVANRDKPIRDTSGVLKINQDGNLLLSDQSGTSIILNIEQLAMSNNTSATLLDSGNLVLKSGGRIVWQSFDYPSDTWLPGMKLGLFDLNTKRPQRRFLTSWVSRMVPSPGAFTLGVNPNNTKELLVWQRGVLYWRSGNWKGSGSSEFPNLEVNLDMVDRLNCSHFLNENESYFTCSMNESDIYRISGLNMDSFGKIYAFSWTQHSSASSPLVSCDTEGYRSEGCATPEPSNCKAGDMFKLTAVDPLLDVYWRNDSLGISDCKEICRRNCSCNAYTSAFSDGMGCKFYTDTVYYYQEGAETFYIRNNTIVVNAHSLIGYIDGTHQCPNKFIQDVRGAGTAQINPDYQIWNTQDQALMTLLNATLSQTALSHVIGYSTSREAWLALERRFSASTRSNILQLKAALHNISKGKDSIDLYIQKIKQARDSLAFVSVLIEDENILIYVLNGLPQEYNAFKTSIRTRSKNITVVEVYTMLKIEKQTIEFVYKQNNTSPFLGAMMATNYRSNSSSNKGYSPFNSSGKGRGRAYNTRSDSSLTNPNYWYIDTGATNHITADLANLNFLVEYQGDDNITVTNGQALDISHSGQSSI
ncbi:hypothetical protein F0562_030060 [Nyssa sinensis]|uniref:Bulb-type lectin domain-containing protein n=1 Tax=Nyssa sinensis TaxID=561372 RepID=A0A5J5AZX0_9ASTE|nr:hypothetical protein F0562_030060 [Nyssa sinensis]